MNSKLKVIIAVVVAAAIVVPVSILAYTSYISSQENPLDFIPSNSTVVLKVNYNNSTYYSFASQSGFGLLFPVNKNFGIAESNLTFNNTKIPIQKYGTVGGFQIYKIELNRVIYGFISNETNRSNEVNMIPAFETGYLENFTQGLFNYSLYMFQPYSDYFILGNIGELNLSISAYIHNDNFSHMSRYLSSRGILEFYFKFGNVTVWGNVSKSALYIYINGNSTYISNLYNYSDYLHITTSVKIIKLNSNTIEIIIQEKSD